MVGDDEADVVVDVAHARLGIGDVLRPGETQREALLVAIPRLPVCRKAVEETGQGRESQGGENQGEVESDLVGSRSWRTHAG